MLRIAVLDNNEQELTCSIHALERFFERRQSPEKQEIIAFADGKSLLESIRLNEPFDIYILETETYGTDGLEAAREIRKCNETAVILFLTSHPEHMYEAFQVEAMHYLFKPAEGNKDFYAAMEKAVRRIASRQPFLLLPTPEGMEKVPYQRICYVEGIGHRIYLHLTDGTTLITSSGSVKLSKIREILSCEKCFIAPHRAYLVNMRQVTAISTGSFTVSGGVHIPISRQKYREVRQQYLNFLGKSLP